MKSKYQNGDGQSIIAFNNENGIEHMDTANLHKAETQVINGNNHADEFNNWNQIKLIETKVSSSNTIKNNQIQEINALPGEFDPRMIENLPIHMNPVISPTQMDSINKFNLQVGYGALKVNGINKLETMEDADNLINHISELSKTQVTDLLNFLKGKKRLLVDQHKSMGDQSQKYVKESVLILSNIQNEVLESQNEINSIFKPLQGDMKSKAISELESKYLNNLTGFVVDKSRYPLAEKIDPIDLSTFSTNIRRSLGTNKDFYLYGDNSLMN